MWDINHRKKRLFAKCERASLSAFSPGFEAMVFPTLPTSLVLSSPHSGRIYPNSFLKQSQQPLEVLRIVEDAFVDQIIAPLAQAHIPLIRALFPRCFVDVSRGANELPPETRIDSATSISPRARVGLGVIPTRIAAHQDIYEHTPSRKIIEDRLAALYIPYHQTLKSLINRTLNQYGHAILLDFHSMPGTVDGIRRPDIILGTRYGHSCTTQTYLIVEQMFKNQGFSVGRDFPYAGGFITQNYGQPSRGVEAIQIEINKDLYLNTQTMCKHDGFDKTRRNIVATVLNIARSLEREQDIAAQ